MADGDLLNMVRPPESPGDHDYTTEDYWVHQALEALPPEQRVNVMLPEITLLPPENRELVAQDVSHTPEGQRIRFLWAIYGAVGGALVGGLAVHFLRKKK